MAAAARVHSSRRARTRGATRWSPSAAPGRPTPRDVARVLGVSEVIVPPASGAASALGFLAAPLSFELVRSHPVEFSRRASDREAVNAVLDELEAQGRARLREAGDRRRRHHRRARRAEMRLRRPDARHRRAAAGRARSSAASRRRHRGGVRARLPRALHHASRPARASRRINFRVRCVGPDAHAFARGRGRRRRSRGQRCKGIAHGLVRRRGCVDTPVYDRYALRPGRPLRRPRDHRGARGDHRRSARRHGGGRRRACNLRIAVGAGHAARPRWSRPDMPLAAGDRAIEADPDRARDHVEPPRHRRRGDVAHRRAARRSRSIISEAQDFACELLDPRRRDAGPFAARHAGVQPDAAARREGAAGALPAPRRCSPATCSITNDPWLCAGHLFDIAIVTPGASATASSSPSWARSGTSPTSAAPRTRCAPARSTRRGSRSRR